MLPDFLIIGAPRAGTGWIAKNLMCHPDIYMPRIKELHFFDRHYEKGIEYYEEIFSHAKGEKAIGEATPEYLYLPEIPPLINKHLPDAKLIVSLRNPVDRLYSRYWNSKAKFIENKEYSFEEKIKSKPLFIEEGYYYDHLMEYLKYFPKEKILILFFDDIKNNPTKVLKEIYSFLDVDINFESPLTHHRINAASVIGFLAKSKLLWYLYKVFERFNIVKGSEYITKVNAADIPPMNKDTKAWLVKEVYWEKNRLLEKLTGRDLSSWDEI